MHPSSQNIPRGGIYPFQKITRKFNFRSVCKKIPKTTAFLFILTLILGIFLYKINFFSFAWNLILQSRIYLCKVEFTFSIHLHFLMLLFLVFSPALYQNVFWQYNNKKSWDLPWYILFLSDIRPWLPYTSYPKISFHLLSHHRLILYT